MGGFILTNIISQVGQHNRTTSPCRSLVKFPEEADWESGQVASDASFHPGVKRALLQHKTQNQGPFPVSEIAQLKTRKAVGAGRHPLSIIARIRPEVECWFHR